MKRITGFISEMKKNNIMYLMFLPVAAYFIIFSYLPMIGIIVAFKSYNNIGGIFGSPWNGLENFRYFFVSGKAWAVTRNTLIYNSVFLVLYNFFSILTAIAISEMKGRLFKKTAQTFMFLPYFISWVVAATFIYNIFNYEYGVVNTILKSMGRESIDIYSNSAYWFILLPLLYIWKWVGFGSVLYLAAIIGIDQECFESATIDGANVFQKIRYITLPLLKPTAVILILLGLGRIARGEFDMFYQLVGNNGALFNATDIIDTLVFRAMMVTQDFGMAASGGFYQSILCFVIILAVNGIIKKIYKDYALF